MLIVQTSSSRHRSVARRGFTLIELLVVIAIIAILAGIIFPVFASVREKARQATCISNMRQIQVALGQYKLDYGKYPPVLFGYAYPNATSPEPMDKALVKAQSDAAMKKIDPKTGQIVDVKNYFPGLYPEFVKDVHIFNDPNNSGSDPSKAVAVPVNVLCPSTDPVCMGNPAGSLVAGTRDFYVADAFDISPQIGAGNNLVSNTYVPRYQLAWTEISGVKLAKDRNVIDPITKRNDYQRQLFWKSVPADTYVASTTYHIRPAGKVMVLWESGAVKAIDASVFLKNGPDVAPITQSGGQSPATFWKIAP